MICYDELKEFLIDIYEDRKEITQDYSNGLIKKDLWQELADALFPYKYHKEITQDFHDNHVL